MPDIKDYVTTTEIRNYERNIITFGIKQAK